MNHINRTHMHRHVEIVRLEGVSHVSEGAQVVLLAGLLEAERHGGFTTFLRKDRKRKRTQKVLTARDHQSLGVAPYL